LDGFVVGKVLYGSQQKSTVYEAAFESQSLVAKVYVSDAKADYERERDVFSKFDSHPHIVAPVKCADLTNEHSGILFFPRYSQSLSELISAFGPLDSSVVVAIARDILLALQHLHAHSLIHCDVKPGNIVLNADGSAFLIDLASAVPVNHPVVEHTSHYALGLHNAPASPSLDLRCLSVTMFQSLTGRIPSSLDNMMTELKSTSNETAQLALNCANAKSISQALSLS
jgi:serine/threonine protein kinase